MRAQGVDPWIEIDGGASGANAKDIKEAGCNAIVAGSAVFNAPDYAEAVKAIKEALFGSVKLSEKWRRRQTLSPLVPAEAVLRGLDARDAALVVLAEHTLSSAAVGECSVWALRAGQLLASCGAGKAQHSVGSHLRSFTLCLRPGDLVALAPKSTASLEEAALVLRCELMRPQDAWSPLQTEAEGPHPSWAKTIFNEYGTH
ncbi:unnamed protein product [Effrenium voratum]|nr:unnamed protein product [Effrenium voratum]